MPNDQSQTNADDTSLCHLCQLECLNNLFFFFFSQRELEHLKLFISSSHRFVVYNYYHYVKDALRPKPSRFEVYKNDERSL